MRSDSANAVRDAFDPSALARERPVHADEVFRRRDVVVDERHAIGQREGGSRRF